MSTTSRESLQVDSSIDTRLDALEPRLSWFYINLLLLTGVSWALQSAELVLLVFTRALVSNDIGMGTRVLEVVGASIFMGSVAGGPIFGTIADSFGRRIALLIAMVFSLGGLAVSARANTGFMLIIGRIVTGLGVSGQLSTTVVLVQELSPSSIRGRVVSLLDAFTGIGGLFGVVLAYAVAPWLGWRTTYLAVCGFVLYTIVLHFTIPESPRWLASIGRVEEASQIIDKIERSHYVNPPCGDFQKEVVGFTSALESPSSAAVKFGRFEQVVPTLRLWALWIVVALSSYALGIYVPTLISFNGYNMFARWETIVALCIAQVLGSLVAAAALDAYGTQRLLLSFTALAAVISIVLSYVPWSSVLVIVGSFLVTALLAGCWSCVLAYSTGRCKSAYRGRGVGYAVGVGRLASVGGCYLYPHMFNVWVFSVPTLCWIFGGALAVVPLLLVQENVANSFSWRSDTDLESGTKLEQAPSSLPSS